MSTFCEVTQDVSDTWVFCPTLLQSSLGGLREKGQCFVVVVNFQLTFSFFVVEVEDCQHCFCSIELQLPGLKVFT